MAIERTTTGLILFDDFVRVNGPLGGTYKEPDPAVPIARQIAADARAMDDVWKIDSNQLLLTPAGAPYYVLLADIPAPLAKKVVRIQRSALPTGQSIGPLGRYTEDPLIPENRFVAVYDTQLGVDSGRFDAEAFIPEGNVVWPGEVSVMASAFGAILMLSLNEFFGGDQNWGHGGHSYPTDSVDLIAVGMPNMVAGDAGILVINADDSPLRVDELAIFAGPSIQMTGLTPGFKLRISKYIDPDPMDEYPGLLVQREGVVNNAGVATVTPDYWLWPFEKAEVLNAVGAVVEILQPSGGLWGGDVLGPVDENAYSGYIASGVFTVSNPISERKGVIKVENPNGGWTELTELDDTNWIVQADWDESVDNPSMTAMVEAFLAKAPDKSLSPLMAASLLNRDIEDAFAPLVQPGRGLRIWMNEEVPELVFDGYIDTVNFAKRLKIDSRDKMGELIDRMIEVARTYIAMPLHELLGLLLIDNFNLDAEDEDPPVLYTVNGTDAEPINPLDVPDAVASPFTQEPGSLGEALREKAQLIGWEIRYLRNPENPSGAHRLTFFEPFRDKLVPDRDFAKNEYFSISNLELSRIDVRNIVKIAFYTGSGVTVPSFVTVRDDASIKKYGRRFMMVVFEPGSQLNTFEEATVFAESALHDLSEPYASKTVEMPLYHQGRLGDLYRFLPNGVHYDEPMTLAPIRFKHSVRMGNIRTQIDCRGNVVGAFRDWLNKETRKPTLENFGIEMEVSYAGRRPVPGQVGYAGHGNEYRLGIRILFPEDVDLNDYVLIIDRVTTVISSLTLAAGTVLESGSYESEIYAGYAVYPDVLSGAWNWAATWWFEVHTVDIQWTVKLALAVDTSLVVGIATAKVDAHQWFYEEA